MRPAPSTAHSADAPVAASPLDHSSAKELHAFLVASERSGFPPRWNLVYSESPLKALWAVREVSRWHLGFSDLCESLRSNDPFVPMRYLLLWSDDGNEIPWHFMSKIRVCCAALGFETYDCLADMWRPGAHANACVPPGVLEMAVVVRGVVAA
eukprot:jgi/Mesvir1/11390/Mv10289-RA.1